MIKVNGKAIRVNERTTGESKLGYNGVMSGVEIANTVYIDWEFESDVEIMYLEELVPIIKKKIMGIGDIYLTIVHMPYMSDGWHFTYGNKLYKFITKLNAIGFDRVRVLDPKNLYEVQGIENIKYWNMKNLVEKCTELTGQTYDYICYMSPMKAEKYAAQGIRHNKVIVYYAAQHIGTDAKVKPVMNFADKGIKDAKVLIIDDTCFKGKTYKTVVEQLKKKGASLVDMYISQLSAESYEGTTLMDTGADNLITLTDELSRNSHVTGVPFYRMELPEFTD